MAESRDWADAAAVAMAGLAANKSKLWLPGMDDAPAEPTKKRDANWVTVEAFSGRDRNTPVTIEDRGTIEYRWTCVQHGQIIFEAKTLEGALAEIDYADLKLLTLEDFDEPPAIDDLGDKWTCDECGVINEDNHWVCQNCSNPQRMPF